MRLKDRLSIILIAALISPCICAQIEVVGEGADKKNSTLGQNPVTESEIPIYNIDKPDFDPIWRAYKELMLRGSYDDAIAELSRLVTMKDNRRLDRLTFYALMTISDAYNLYLKTNDKKTALELLKIASSLDSKLPDAYFIPFYIEMKSGLGAFGRIGDLVKGILVYYNEPYNRLSGYSILIGLLIRSLAIAGMVFAGLLLFKFNRNLRYDAATLDIFSRNDSMKKFAGWFFLLLPFVFWLGFEYILLYLLVILLPYARPSLKMSGIIIILGMFLYVPWLEYNTALVKTIDDENAKFFALAEDSFYSHNMNELVNEQRMKNPYDPDIEFTQVKILMAYGKLADAYNAYRILNKKYPNRVDILINMGNIRYYNASYEMAKMHYEEAIDIDPNNVYALYNYKLSVEQLDPFRDTSDLKRQIIKLDSSFYESVTTAEGEKKELVEMKIPVEKKTGRLNEILTGHLYSNSNEAAALSIFFGNPLTVVASVALIAFLILSTLLKRNGHSEKCQKCLRIFKPSSSEGDIEDKYCKQCVSIFFKKEGVSPEVQRAKIVQINQVRKKEKVVKLVFSFLIPGSRNVYSDRGLSGFLILWKWIFLIMAVFLGESIQVYPFRAIDLSFGPLKTIALILLLQTQLTSIFLGLIRMNKGD